MPRQYLLGVSLIVLLPAIFLFLNHSEKEEVVLASPETVEIPGWQTTDFTVPFKDWDNPLGIEGLNNSGLNKETCMYQVESLNPETNEWEMTHNSDKRICNEPITVTVGEKTGEGWKGKVDLKVQTADCKYPGENACKITAWSEDHAGNSNLGTNLMAIKIYDIDFDPPSSEITDITSTTRPGGFLGKWLKADTYTFSVSDNDPGLNPSGINPGSCAYFIFDVKKGTTKSGTRTCNSTITFEVGPDKDCRTDDPTKGEECWIYLFSKDKAGNDNKWLNPRSLDIDFTLPFAK